MNGWATFDASGSVIEWGQFHRDNITRELERLVRQGLKAVICEDYRNHGHARNGKHFGQKKWSRNETSKVIGKIELMCDLRGVRCVLQSNTCKPIGYKWAGLDAAPSNHDISHQFDAIAHGVYWLQSNGIRPVGQAMLNKTKDK